LKTSFYEFSQIVPVKQSIKISKHPINIS